jgi:hypothetical protein
MSACTRCGGQLEATFRFCPWCASPQRRKLVEFFRAHPRDPGLALRVSRYFGDEPQVRISIWEDEVAQAAVSLEVDEAKRLARFLDVSTGDTPSLAGRVREAARAALRG